MGIDAEIDTSQGGDIIQTLKDEIICSICCVIFEDLLKLDCCDGHLCKLCFEDVKKKCPSCPLCRAPNYSAKPSRLMVSVLSTITLCCPAEDCYEKILYNQFIRHKETCAYLNVKKCDQCDVKMEGLELERHVSCVESLVKKMNDLKNMNEAMKMKNDSQKKIHEAAKKSNEAEKKKYTAEKKKHAEEMKKYEATKTAYAGLTKKHRVTLAENTKNASKVNELNKALEESRNTIKQLKLSSDEDLHQKQTNRIKNMEAEAKNLKQSIQQHKKNAATAKQTEMQSKKKIQCYQDHNKELQDEIVNMKKIIEQQNEQDKRAQFYFEERIKQPYESKIGALEAALKNMEPLTIKFEKMKSDKAALQAEVLKLQKQVFSFEQEQGYLKEPIVPKFIELEKSYNQICKDHQNGEKELADANKKLSEMANQLDDKNNQIAKMRTDEAMTKEHLYNLSADHSSQITKLKNEIASVEKTAKLYFQMYSDERKLNQNREDEKTGVFGLFRRK